jgi:hypothetical protein
MDSDKTTWRDIFIWFFKGVGNSVLAFLKHWKETTGAVGMIYITILWLREDITQERAIFGIGLMLVGGFINNDKFDLIGLFKYLGNYKKGGGNDEPA